jgi:hypothetical protein
MVTCPGGRARRQGLRVVRPPDASLRCLAIVRVTAAGRAAGDQDAGDRPDAWHGFGITPAAAFRQAPRCAPRRRGPCGHPARRAWIRPARTGCASRTAARPIAPATGAPDLAIRARSAPGPGIAGRRVSGAARGAPAGTGLPGKLPGASAPLNPTGSSPRAMPGTGPPRQGPDRRRMDDFLPPIRLVTGPATTCRRSRLEAQRGAESPPP